MALVKRLHKIGPSSKAVVIPASFLEQLGIDEFVVLHLDSVSKRIFIDKPSAAELESSSIHKSSSHDSGKRRGSKNRKGNV